MYNGLYAMKSRRKMSHDSAVRAYRGLFFKVDIVVKVSALEKAVATFPCAANPSADLLSAHFSTLRTHLVRTEHCRAGHPNNVVAGTQRVYHNFTLSWTRFSTERLARVVAREQLLARSGAHGPLVVFVGKVACFGTRVTARQEGVARRTAAAVNYIREVLCLRHRCSLVRVYLALEQKRPHHTFCIKDGGNLLPCLGVIRQVRKVADAVQPYRRRRDGAVVVPARDLEVVRRVGTRE